VLQRAEGLAAQLSNKERALKERVSIDAGIERSKARVAEKADEIARKMQALADHADSQWSKAKSELASDSKGFKEVKEHASKALSDAKEKESARREAEKAATAAAKQLAELDRTIQGLLAKKSQLEDQANAQDASSATVSSRARARPENDDIDARNGSLCTCAKLSLCDVFHAGESARCRKGPLPLPK
jgi:uncharacterized coiled-coil DUF342 family protein